MRIHASLAPLALAATALIAGCGGGTNVSTADTYVAVEGAQSTGGATFTACVDGANPYDPASPSAQRTASQLATHYRMVGAYRRYGGEGETCRQRFPAATAVLSADELACASGRTPQAPECLR